MKILKTIAVAVAMTAGVMMSASALAAHGGGGHGGGGHGGGWHGGGWYGHSNVRFGFAFGWPGYGYPGAYYSPYYYPPYYPYYPAGVGVPASPPVYVEQGQQGPAASAPPAPAQAYWYYCAESQAYYPYVNQCAGQWQRVSPQPPS